MKNNNNNGINNTYCVLRDFLYHTCPLQIDSECGSREGHKKLSMVKLEKATLVNYLEDYWPCAGGLSAGNAIGTRLHDPINSGLPRGRWTAYVDTVAEIGRNPVSKHQIDD